MIELADFFSELRNQSGINLEFSRVQPSTKDLRFRIKGFPPNHSFSFRMNRGWRSSQLIFEPDTFSQTAVTSMVCKIAESIDEVIRLIEDAEAKLSSFEVKVDGLEVHKIEENYDYSSSNLSILAEVYSDEEVPSASFLSDGERQLVEKAVLFTVFLLSTNELTYVAADEAQGFPEGAVETITVNRYERDGRNRAEAIRIHGMRCAVCDFNFSEFYGPLGTGFIVVHHVFPVSQLGPDYEIDPATDLVCICANCHAMVHRSDPPITVLELRELVKISSKGFSDGSGRAVV